MCGGGNGEKSKKSVWGEMVHGGRRSWKVGKGRGRREKYEDKSKRDGYTKSTSSTRNDRGR